MSSDLILLGISLMIWGVGESMFFIFQPLYLQQLGADSVTIGVIIGATGIAMALPHMLAGHLADRIGRKPILITAWCIGLLAAWIMALAPTLPIFVFGMMLYGLTAFVSSPLNSYITAARNNLSVSRVLTMVSAMYTSGAIFGPWLGGIIGNSFGLRAIYILAACIFILSTAVILFIKSQPIDPLEDEQSNNRKVVNKRFISYQLIIFMAGFSMYLAQPLSSNYLQNQQQLSLDSIGILGSISAIGIVVLNLGLGSINPRAGYLLGQLCVCIFNLILWRATGFAWFCLAYFLVGGYRITRSLATAQTRNLIHQSRMGFAYGITETVGSSAIILASPAAGVLYSINPALMYIVGFFLIIFSMITSALFMPRSENLI